MPHSLGPFESVPRELIGTSAIVPQEWARAPAEQLAHVPADLLTAYICQTSTTLALVRQAIDGDAKPSDLWNAFEMATGLLETACDIVDRVERPAEEAQAA